MELPLLQGDYYRFYIYEYTRTRTRLAGLTLAVYICTCIHSASGVVRLRACEKVGVLGLAQSSTFWSVFYATNASGSLHCSSNCASAVATFSLPLVCVRWAELSWAGLSCNISAAQLATCNFLCVPSVNALHLNVTLKVVPLLVCPSTLPQAFKPRLSSWF